MVNIEDLLGKVANNGATLLGVLAHGEWNTLVQAVRELQQIVASDERLEEQSARIAELTQTLADSLSTITTDINAITAEDQAHHTARIAGIITSAITYSTSTVETSVDWTMVYYSEYLHRFVCKYNEVYYTFWEGMNTWCSNSGIPYGGKVYIHDNRLYSYDSTSGLLKEAGAVTIAAIENAISILQETVAVLGGSAQENSEDIEALQSEALSYHHMRFDGIISEYVRMEQTALPQPTGAYVPGKVYFSEYWGRFFYQTGQKNYDVWWQGNLWNDQTTWQPYINKMYINDNKIYMFNATSSRLEQVGFNIFTMTNSAYEALVESGHVDELAFYATYEDEEE